MFTYRLYRLALSHLSPFALLKMRQLLNYLKRTYIYIYKTEKLSKILTYIILSISLSFLFLVFGIQVLHQLSYYGYLLLKTVENAL